MAVRRASEFCNERTTLILAGWIVAEVGRQPWAIQDILPTSASISKLATSSVQTTFFLFLILFTILLIAEVGIMVKAIKKGPAVSTNNEN